MDVLGGWDGRRAGAVGPAPSGDPLHQRQFGGDGISQLCRGSCSGSSASLSTQNVLGTENFLCGKAWMWGWILHWHVCDKWGDAPLRCCRKNKSKNCQIKPRESVKVSIIQNSGPKSYNCPCLVLWKPSAGGGLDSSWFSYVTKYGRKNECHECFCSGRLRVLSEELILSHICLSCCMNIDNEVRKRDLSPWVPQTLALACSEGGGSAASLLSVVSVCWNNMSLPAENLALKWEKLRFPLLN